MPSPFSFLIGFSIILLTEYCVCESSLYDEPGLQTLVNAPRLRREVGLRNCTPQVVVIYQNRQCTEYRSRTKQVRVKKGSWWSSDKYRLETETVSVPVCCLGYYDIQGPHFFYNGWWAESSNRNSQSLSCKPTCRGSENTNVCNKNEGHIVFKDSILTCSGGGCVSPNKCDMCNDGYYEDSGYCSACPAILHCNHQRCSKASDSACVFCEQEVLVGQPGYQVYSHTIDNVNCVKMCSWREGSRCYPGKCLGKMVLENDCKCTSGFGGKDCATFSAMDELKILTNEITLRGVGVPPLVAPDPERPLVKVWTNQVLWSDISIVVKTSAPGVEPPAVAFQSYLDDAQTKVGIKKLVMSAMLRRGNQTQTWREDKLCYYNITCNIDLLDKKFLAIPWKNILNGGNPDHLDLMTVTTALTFGGNVYFYNRDDTYKTGVSEKLEFYSIRGLTVNSTTEIQFDLYPPVHCLEDGTPCSKETIVVHDFVDKFPIPIYWDGWRDDHSGLRRFYFHVYQLEAKGGTDSQLTPKQAIVFQTVVNSTQTSTTINVTTPGPYFVEIMAEDWAGNTKSSRRIFMYDDVSRVDLTGSIGCVVNTADPVTDNKWINTDSNMVEITWSGRFINQRHHSNNWLNEVAMMDDISRQLDDTPSHSARNLSAIHSIRGIVKVMVGYNVSYGEGRPVETKVPVNVPRDLFDQERMVFPEELKDGKRLTFVLLGYDIMGQYAEDTATVDIDLSPPIIDRLWLTLGDVLNISVHSVEELNKLTIEWEAYDVHSGLHQISWRIFDNFTQTDVLHGNSTEHAQGEANTLIECQTKYKDHARGARCYCTPYHGCFHKHYQIKPTVGSQGLQPDKQTGVHESDYFIEVTAINLAFLRTVSVLKITIDTSPPHKGTVHDGFEGEPEVDFQQSLTLHAHWGGFFDKESSVWFYLYAFTQSCLSGANFDIITDEDLSLSPLKKTYSRSAEFSAPSEGTYHVTVAAYNHAYQHSIPVCSDGVTINNVAARVTEVVVKGAITREGLLMDETERVWLVYTSRQVEEIINPSSECMRRAITVSTATIDQYPGRRQANGTLSTIKSSAVCNRLSTLHPHLLAFVTSNTHLELSWNVTDDSSVHDFEIALSSDNTSADKMDFVSSRGHQHIKIIDPNIWDGQEFNIIIKTISKSGIVHDTIVGPFVVDTTKPEFHGTIVVQLEQSAGMRHLVASWQPDAFEDHGDPAQLLIEVAIGSRQLHHDVLPFGRLLPGCSCQTALTCTAINIDRLDWRLHGHQSYYVTVKATNAVGMFTLASSDEYVHDVEPPSKGVVYDVDVNSNFLLQDIDDIDFQAATDTMSSRWSGFEHPHLNISYIVCVIDTNTSSALTCEATSNTKHTFNSLSLQPFQSYYQEVTAVGEAGNVSVGSNGLTVFKPGLELSQIYVHNGPSCDNIRLDDAMSVKTSHHDEDKRFSCLDEHDYQSATNEVHVRWKVDEAVQGFTPDVYWALEQRAPVTDFWQQLTDFEHITTAHHLKVTGLSLMTGRRYRVALKFCADNLCYNPVTSDGVTILANPPKVGTIAIQYDKHANTIQVELESFRDPDIEDEDEAREVMDHYEWALTDDGHTDRLLTKWQRVNMTKTTSDNKVTFSIHVKDNITFTKCWRVSVRGYNKAGLSTAVSSEIKNCSDVNQVRPHAVLDAVGKPTYSKDGSLMHQGQPVMLRENNLWTEPDSDYTPYKNILSAVWPSLRYPVYSWAVLEVKNEDATVFYGAASLDLFDPCLHPDAVQCGTTDVEYVNVMFSSPGLQHGVRYMVCIHGNATSIEYEKWSLDLEDLDACSDGITVDLTPPTQSQVWIGKNLDDKFQSSTSCLTVNWQSFIDVEEEGHSAHVSGVAGYQVAIGSSHGGVDIVEFTDVGLTNHHMFHGLRLQNGHAYFATVRAEDFTGQTSLGFSRSIRVDASPPVLTGQPIQLTGRHITDTARISACWKGVFTDMDSGMSHYEWSVGSEQGYGDIMTYTITDMECSESDSSVSLNLKEGYAYFVSVKGYDNAGHYTLAVSWAFTVDASPPHQGHVFDGVRPVDGTYRDIDYTTSTSVLDAHWTEFYEPHGALKEYSVHVGSCVECDDILKHQSVGLMTEIHLSGLLLSEGQRYYVSVTACNTVDMCTVTSSDGIVVDRSPPIAGRVQDGVGGVDIQYQSSRLYLGAEWFGFTDAQSGISHYVWRAGTQPGADDVLGATSVIRSEKAYIVDLTEDTGKQLPVGQRIHTTVRAYNLAGMYSESTSNGFIVDTSGPVFSGNVTHRRIGSVAVNTSVLPSVLRVEWEVWDNESFVDEQYLSIESHLGGDFNASSVKVAGLVRDYTFSDLDLHDGSVYCVNLVSCNGARICEETRLRHLLVDSSPPTPGMFAIDTDHAISLKREPDSWMTWSVLYVNLAWLGFQDVHSGIDRYMINIGSTFMANDLHKVSSKPHVVAHNDTGSTTAEGSVQVYRIWTKSLAKQRSIFVSIWAINGVGLSSPIIHHEFELVQGGDLELVRRCSAHTCLGHCVCAPHGQLCHPDNFCNDLSNDTSSLRVTVDDMLDLTFDPAVPAVFFYPTRTLTAARWSMTSTAERKPLWYEWSIGETLYGTPKGVFDLETERVWHDAGQNISWIYTHPRGHFLKEKTQYSFFVRAWFDENTYAVYKSPGVLIYSTPPLSVSIQGKKVKELLAGSGQDVDFVTPSMPLVVDWQDRFADTHGSLLKYHLYISTYPGGHDAHCVAMNLPPTQTSYNITGLKLLEDTKYYSVVQVFNKAGYHRTEWSDGFLVDSRPPVAGIVHDGEVLKDIHALNSSRWIPSFWYGFTDADAGIKSYNVCVMASGGRHCNVHPQVNVGLNTHAELFPNEDMSDGTVLHSAVQALDFVGLRSAWVKSNGVIIDSSSPIRSSNYKYSENIIRNPSFEVSSSNETLNDIKDIDSCTDKPVHSWNIEKGGCCLSVKTSGNHLPADGQQYVILSGVMYQDITNLTVGSKYRLSFYTSHVPSGRTLLSNSEGFVEFNNEKHAFLLYNKPSLSQVNRESDLSLGWHKHTYYFISTETTTRLRISTMGRTNHIAVDFVSLESRDTSHDGEESEQQGHIQAHTVFIHDWSSIHAEWNFVEEDSEIVEYLWAIGTVEGGTQLQPFTSVGKRTFAFTSSLHLVHDTTVFVTVVAVNAASLRTVSYSDPILIDLTPPEIVSIFDGNVQGEDIDFQRGYKVTSSWVVRDVESGIRGCDWAIDTGASDIRIQNFTAVPSGLFNVSADVPRDSVIDNMIYVSVRCTNNAGLMSHSSSDGVMILTSPPSADSVLLEILGTSMTQYPVKDGYHGDMSRVRFRWIGFDVDQGIDSYLVSLDGAEVHEEEIVTASRNGFTYACFTNLHLAEGNYSVSVVARNHLDMFSKKQIADFTLLSTRPFLTGESINCAWTSTNHELQVAWPSVFSFEWPLYYEVTLSWADGGEGDIVQWQETKDTSLLVSLSLDNIPQAGINVRISVRAINPAGQFTIAQTEKYVII